MPIEKFSTLLPRDGQGKRILKSKLLTALGSTGVLSPYPQNPERILERKILLQAAFNANPVSPPPSTPGLLSQLFGYWNMNQAANTTRTDSTANSFDMTDTHLNVGSAVGALNNCAIHGPGGGGSGMLQHASVANLSAGVGVSFSASVWALCTSGAFAAPIMGKGNNINVAGVEWFIRNAGTSHYNIVAWDTAGNATAIDVGANSNVVFRHLVITFDDTTKRLSGYMDGVLGGTGGGSGFATLLNSVNSNAIPFIFFDYPGNEGFTFGGSIDEAAYWRRALSQADVTKLFNGGTPLPFSSFT